MNSRMSEASSLMSSRDNQPALNTERTADDLTNFIRINTTSVDSGFLCMMCGTLIRQKTNLRRHFLDKHVDDGVHYHCPHCNRTKMMALNVDERIMCLNRSVLRDVNCVMLSLAVLALSSFTQFPLAVSLLL